MVTAVILGYAGLVVVQVGRTGGRGWRDAARTATRTGTRRPGTWAAASGVCCLAGLLAVLVTPLAVPILAGYALAALHAVHPRTPASAAVPALTAGCPRPPVPAALAAGTRSDAS
ncbi:hypothetical protein MRQ36_25650 [Micromonospora sp. R77]|uniref:hypothetical protein n=1 Tax=Micromonospora sp. R77 TaxID=2925836 RepID=UPI001F6127CC|nr:hypothetical protein [Micromonospora sp. R77]MCI4065759.1 hypothetical protein [Micromonospora sp. R77]